MALMEKLLSELKAMVRKLAEPINCWQPLQWYLYIQ